jgi:hypothetical protein
MTVSNRISTCRLSHSIEPATKSSERSYSGSVSPVLGSAPASSCSSARCGASSSRKSLQKVQHHPRGPLPTSRRADRISSAREYLFTEYTKPDRRPIGGG